MKKSQKQIILDRLKKGKPVNAVWCAENYILRLSGRIMDLRKEGYKIESFALYKGKRKLPYCGYRLI